MTSSLRAGLAAFVLLALITGVAYPLLTTALGQLLFPAQANGSLVLLDGQVVGSSLIGQVNADPIWFQGRPSAVNAMQSPDGALMSSGASNLGWTNPALAALIEERAEAVRLANGLAADAPIPADLLFASGSGLDPHISPESAALQIDRVAAARSLDRATVEALVAQFTETPQLGVLGQARVNVLLLNLALAGLE